jgi:hypothetical protein
MKRSARTALFALLSILPCAPLAAQHPRGEELVVHPVAGRAGSVDVAAAQNGDFAVVWQMTDGQAANVFFRLFRADGRPRTGEIRVAGSEAGRQRAPRVAMAPDGRFLIVWEARTTATARQRIFARRFAADGRPLGPRFPVTAPPEFDQLDADAGLARDGRFVVTWSQGDGGISPDDGGPTINLWSRRFRPDGQPAAPAFLIEDAVTEASGGRVAMRPAGDFVVAWGRWNGEASFNDIVVQSFRADGTPRAAAVQVNHGETEGTTQSDAAVALAPDGRFLVVWMDLAGDIPDHPDGSVEDHLPGIVAQLFGSDGAPRGENFRVNVFTLGAQEHPAVALTGDGGFLIAWTSGGDQDGDGRGIFARSIAPDGRRRGREFRINLGREGEQAAPALGRSISGRGAVAWTSVPEPSGPDAESGIFARRFEP